MRKIIFLMHVSLDGLVAGPNGEMDWIVYDNQLETFVHGLHKTTDTAIYGRVTYEMMASYWPTVLTNPESTPGDRNHAHWLETATKIVVSKTLVHADWENTLIINDNLTDEINKLKQQSGKDMWLIGSPSLAQSFMKLGLIDEYWLNVNPVILGKGKPLFADLSEKISLKLLETKAMEGGEVILRYEVKRD